MKKKTIEVLGLSKKSRMTPFNVAQRLRAQLVQLELLASDTRARLEIVEAEARNEQRNA